MISRDSIADGQFSFKKLGNLRVVDVNTGERASINQSVIRNAPFISGALSFIAIVPILGMLALALLGLITSPLLLIDGFMVMIGQRRITDRIAGTTVVHDRDVRETPLWAKAVLGFFCFVPIGIVIIAFGLGFLSAMAQH